ncbi:tether containing UBX domain for GLUT4 isoform X2 [Balaenoptera acutorostrata]|uniref:Tether containing UBX domain for GLUT4 isoform X2 n=1 Tax=Balaenoptera acutorostrata TaxID=9767 RepID=A0ABM3SRB8_BALAC|nr:tether containing UBX domain for GLUT4 isoform X2 [Balaenoptera acutorostrata]
MAAPAGSGGSAVSVLAPNGRRHTVKVTPSTVLLQVLEDTCRRQDFNPNEYDLKFQRNVLDLSLQWRFANLPNNAKLEMVPISRSREGPENMVRIALQLDDGSRLQDTFCSGQTLWELLCHFAQIRECLDRPCEASPVCVYMRDEVTGGAALQSTTLQSLGLTGGSAIIRFSMKPHDSTGKQEPGVSWSKSPGSPTPSLLADQAASSPLFPLNSAGLSQGDVSHQDEAARPGAGRVDGLGPKPVDAQAKQISKEPTPAPFVPFSGGGQRLGGPSGSVRPLMSSSAKLPKSFSSPAGPSQPKKSRPGQEPQPEPELPVDRDPVVCHPDLEVLLQAWPAELPDEFFEVTVDDVRRRLAQLKSERKRLEEAPLVTKAFRDAQMKEKLQRYPKVVLRVLFPDRYILQGFFRPSETVGDLRDFVRSHLGNPKLPFYLFIAPPKTILDDHTLTLFQLALEPWGLCSEWRPCPPVIRELAGLREGSLPPSCGQTSSLLPLCTLDLRSQQASTWSPRCWNTPFPRLQLTCWWPGPCPGPLEPHPRRQPLTLRPLSWSQLLRKGQWAPLSPALGRPSRQQEVRAASPEVPLCHHRTPAHPERE